MQYTRLGNSGLIVSRLAFGVMTFGSGTGPLGHVWKAGQEEANALVGRALEQGKAIRDFCTERFKDYQFGLKLVAQNTGREEFTIDTDAVEAPDKVLSDWVVASYRKPAG